MGLLPEVAASLGVGIPTAGWLVTGYALGIAVGGPILVLCTLRVPRRTLLVALGAAFVAATAICALAPSYMTGRVLASLAHGAFVGAAVVVATRLVAPEREGMAVAAVIGGFTVATVIGVPLGTLVGQAFGWRSVFWAIAAVAALSWVGMMASLPRPDGAEPVPDLRREVGMLGRPSVLAALATTALGFGGLFAAYTYVAPILRDVSGFAPEAVPVLLLVFGVGAVMGNLAGGKLADRALMPTLIALLSILAATLLLLPILGTSQIATTVLLFVMGAAAFGATPGVQLRVVGEAREAPYLASTLNVTAFNLGNAAGAFLGGVLIAETGRLAPAAWAGAAMTASAVVVTLLAARARPEHPRPV